MTVSQNMFILTALITTAIAAGGAPQNLARPDQTEAISEVNTQQKPMAIPEEAIGETVARMLEKMNQMQRTVDDLRASNYELRASIDDHKATIDKLTDSNTALSRSNNILEASNTELTNRLYLLERSKAESTICEGVRECLYVEAKEREALSKDLFDAAEEGNAREIRRLAAMGAHLEYRHKTYNTTALHVAAWDGHVEAVKALIEMEAHLEARNFHAQTPIHTTVSQKREECVELLLSAGASVNARDVYGRAALHYGAAYGTPSIVQKLIEAGADRGATDNNGNTPKDVTNDADIINILNNYFPVSRI